LVAAAVRLVAAAAALAVKAAVVAAAATVTLVGTVTAALLLESDTTAPPLGAAFVSVTVQVAVPPLASAVGLQVSEPTRIWVVTVTVVTCDEPA
jgi:fructoselysine-6-P-deglycase FrlB-like protein